MATLPSGILNAILTNIGAKIILAVIPKVRFHSRHKQTHITVITIFIMSYLSMGILVMKRYWEPDSSYYLPFDFTPAWLLFYGSVFRTQMIMSNYMQYLAPCFKIMFKRGCCCCRRKNYMANTHNNGEFSMERRYATILTTSFICFNYGFALPMLFITASVIFLGQYLFDKLLVTYYYKERVEHNDYLNRSSLIALKYGIVVFLYFSGKSLTNNYCSVTNQT